MVNGFIFSAGLGTRLKPLTDNIPKALVPLAGKPLLQWQVEKFRDAGIRDIVVNVHHFPDMIIDTIRANEGWGCNILISDEREHLLETGGGLYKAWKEGRIETTKPLLACNVDILSNIDLRALLTAWDNYQLSIVNSQLIGLLVVSPRETQRYLLFDEQDTLRGWTNIQTGETKGCTMYEGQYTKYAFSGMQILSPTIFEKMDKVVSEKGECFSLIDLYLSLCETETVKAFIPENYRMMDVGKINQLADAETFAQSLTL